MSFLYKQQQFLIGAGDTVHGFPQIVKTAAVFKFNLGREIPALHGIRLYVKIVRA